MTQRGNDSSELNRTIKAEEKIAMVKQVFSHLKLPVEISKMPIPRLNKYSVAFNGAVIGYLEPEKQDFEKLLAVTAGHVFRAMYKIIRKHAEDREKLANAAYYHVIGHLGVDVMSDIPEESKKKPAWLKRFPKYSPLFTGPYGPLFNADHVFYSRNGEYISEPYYMSMMDFENLVKFCRENGLEFHVKGESRHFPGHTFRLVIRPKKES